jgi:ABC-type uncharacterized transport system involved in gliding motility auxiliary subunit
MRRWSFLLAALLGLAVFVESARLVERLVRVRVDLSEDQLLSPSPATRELLGSLEDVAQVTLYASGESDSAPFQLARRRVNEELAELAGLARGRMRLVQVDPSRSSTAALEAAEYGIEARSIATVESSSLTSEIVFLGGVLRYRGREHVFPTFLPGAVEYQLVTALASLVRDARPRLGWFAPGRAPERFRTARDLLSRRAEIVPIGGIEEGRELGELDAVVVLAPEDLHPRAAYELDQHLQRGGALLLVLDRSYAGVEEINERRIERVDTGLEAWLAKLGVGLSSDLIWDSQFHRPLQLRRVVRDGSGGVREETLEVPYPLWPYLAPAGFDATHPATARLAGLPLRWAHALELDPQRTAGLRVDRLLQTSSRSFRTPFEPGLDFDGEAIELTEAELVAGADAGRQLVGAALVGRFHSPFVERGAPPARDPFGGAERALDGDDQVASGAAEARLIVLSDADWLAERGGRIAPESGLLLENLVDWLGLSPELLELRSKRPSDRSIRDLEREAFEARGLSTLQAAPSGARAERSRAENEALDAARRARRRTMWTALGGSLASVAAVVAAALVRRGTRLRPIGGGGR